MRKAITKRAIDALKAGEIIADTEIRGFVARRLPSGTVTYGYRYRDTKTGLRRWVKLGLHGNLTPDEARTQAKKRAGEVADKRDPLAETREARSAERRAAGARLTVIAARFIERHAKRQTRRWPETDRILKLYVLPLLGERPIHAITRRDIVEMLDLIEDRKIKAPESGRMLGGPVMADRVLAVIRKLFNWYAAQGDHDFRPPIVKGMARTKPKERARDRVLTDEELRAFWRATEGNRMGDVFGAAARFMLLSAQRPGECLSLRRSDIDREGVWTLEAGRYKTKRTHWVPLSKVALVLVEAQPVPRKGDHVFTTLGDRPFSGDAQAKKRLDTEMLTELRKPADERGAKDAEERKIILPRWVLHDLRRTARSLMSRAGVRPDVAERVLGHVIGGVAGVYDRYQYLDEKRAALEALASLVDRILAGETAQVVALRKSAPSG